MKILGLDTSTTSTGYAVLDNEKLISYGTIKTPKKADLLDKIIYIEEHIKQIIKAKEAEPKKKKDDKKLSKNYYRRK